MYPQTDIKYCKLLIFDSFAIVFQNVHNETWSSLTIIILMWLKQNRIKGPLYLHASRTNLAIHIFRSME